MKGQTVSSLPREDCTPPFNRLLRDFMSGNFLLDVAEPKSSPAEIGRTNASAQKRFAEIKKAVERDVDRNAWRQKFVGNDVDDADFFDDFAWTGLLEAVHAELWPR